ncbi:MAG: hypothetical protein ACP5G1_04640, partial [Nanopusillaceae archaeon]
RENSPLTYDYYFKNLNDGILFLKAKIIFVNVNNEDQNEFKLLYKRIKELKDSICKEKKEECIARSRLENMRNIITYILDQINEGSIDNMSPVIALVYYLTKDESKYGKNKVITEMVNEIKDKFSINKENIDKIRNMFEYWLSIIDYVLAVTRQE